MDAPKHEPPPRPEPWPEILVGEINTPPGPIHRFFLRLATKLKIGRSGSSTSR
jgi:hypothetical protein